MSDELMIEGRSYISSKRASESSGYTQDYIGQLARSGLIEARRIGGLWYISEESLHSHKNQADDYKPEPPTDYREHHRELDSFVALDGKDYISSVRASDISGYNKDYVGQLARSGQILARQVGNRWYVERESLLAHKGEKDALLAAVQAESVGLVQKHADKISVPEEDKADIMKYFLEEHHPTPVLRGRDSQKINHISHKIEEEAFVRTEEHAVPIRVIRESPRPDMKQNMQFVAHPGLGFARAARNASLAGAALTIIVLLSFGFTSLKSQSLYTLRALPQASSMAASASATLSMLGDVIERWVASEIVYHRGQ